MTDDNDSEKLPSHVAWAMQRRRKGRATFTVALEVGTGRIDPDGTPRVFLDREPKGGYGDWIAKIVLLPLHMDPTTKTPPEETDQTENEGDEDEARDRPDRDRILDDASRFAARCAKS